MADLVVPAHIKSDPLLDVISQMFEQIELLSSFVPHDRACEVAEIHKAIVSRTKAVIEIARMPKDN